MLRVLLVCFLLFLSNPLTAQTISRIEPPNWWVGMKHSEFQITVYGEDVAYLKPQVEYPGVQVSRVEYVDNLNYLFAYLRVSEEAKPGTVQLEFMRKGELVVTKPFELRARKPLEERNHGFSQADVLYLITPDRFANGNAGNDNLPGMSDSLNRAEKFGRHGGDIQGMRDKLDYIRDIGFTAIWMNPVIENNMPRFSYHGYAATDFYAIDRRFGSNEEFKALCEEAGERGIKIIMDMILNHCGTEHWFVKDTPTLDWLNSPDNLKFTTHRRTVNQDIHASRHDKQRMSDGWFSRSMPDLNQRNPFLADYLIVNTLWWIEYAGIAGIRMDTYPYPDKYFMSRWTCAVMKEYPNFSVVAEEWSYNPAIVSYWQRAKINNDGYTSCLTSMMDFPLQGALVEGLTEKDRHRGGFLGLYEMVANDFQYADPFNLVTFADNHDMNRVATSLNNNPGLIKMALAFLATMRGIPQFYYGTEIMMENNTAPRDHGIIRSDFPGGWTGDSINAFTGDGLTPQQQDLQAYTKKLLNWRKTSKPVHSGKLIHFVPEDGVYVYFRYTRDEMIMVALSKNVEAKTISATRFDEMLQGERVGRDVSDGEKIDFSKGLELEPNSVLILEILRMP